MRDRVDLPGVDLAQVGGHRGLQPQPAVSPPAAAPVRRWAVARGRLPAGPAARPVAVAEVEAGEPGQRLVATAGDLVEVVLHGRGEPVVDQVAEVALEQPDHGEGGEARHQRGALLPHVAPVEDGGDHAGVGRRPADAQLLHGLHQRRLGVAGRRLGGVRARLEARAAGPRSPSASGGSTTSRSASSASGSSSPFDVGPQEAGEGDDPAAGRELDLGTPARAPASAGHGRRQADLGARPGGVGHLRGDGALPDQVVEAQLVAVERAAGLVGGAERVAGRPDRLVGLLGVLDLALVAAGRVGHVVWP